MWSNRTLLLSIILFLLPIGLSCTDSTTNEPTVHFYQINGTVYSLPDSLPIKGVLMQLYRLDLLYGTIRTYKSTSTDESGKYSIRYYYQWYPISKDLRAVHPLYQTGSVWCIDVEIEVQTIDFYLTPVD